MGRHKASDFNAAQFTKNMNALPELCYAIDPVTDRAVILQRGTSGYYPVDHDKFPFAKRDPAAFVLQQNTAMQITDEQREAMIFGSMFGWDTPGADPEGMLATNKVAVAGAFG